MNSGKSRLLGFLFLGLTVLGSVHAVVSFHFCHGELVSIGIMKDAKKCWGHYEAILSASEEQQNEHVRTSCCDESQVLIESILECEEAALADATIDLLGVAFSPASTDHTDRVATSNHYKNPLHHRYRHVLFENFRC